MASPKDFNQESEQEIIERLRKTKQSREVPEESKTQDEKTKSTAQGSADQPKKKKAIHIEVSQELHTRLKTLAAERGISIKDLVTDTLIEKYAKELIR